MTEGEISAFPNLLHPTENYFSTGEPDFLNLLLLLSRLPLPLSYPLPSVILKPEL